MNQITSLKNKKIWVAGHSGMVGSSLCRSLKGQGCDILAVNHDDLDLTRQQETENWVRKNHPDIIIVAAARVGGIIANSTEQAQFLYENMAISQNIIHAAKLYDVEKLLYLGSSCIYPAASEQPIKEEYLLSGKVQSNNEGYAIAKIAALKMCEKYKEQYGCNFISAMPCNLYGQNDYFDENRSHVIPALIMKIHAAKIKGESEVELWGTGKPLREFLYVDDLANACIFLLKNYSGVEHINIGAGSDVSIKYIAQEIAKIVGYNGKVLFNPEMPDGVYRKLMDSSKINDMGWEPNIDLSRGLKMAYDYYLSNLD